MYVRGCAGSWSCMHGISPLWFGLGPVLTTCSMMCPAAFAEAITAAQRQQFHQHKARLEAKFMHVCVVGVKQRGGQSRGPVSPQAAAQVAGYYFGMCSGAFLGQSGIPGPITHHLAPFPTECSFSI